MSNFTCPTCGFTNIDCGKAGYKTAREIELEKKLEIAVEATDIIDRNIRKENMRLQAEINRLKKVLKDIFMIAKRNKSALLATPENNTLSLIENECALALIGESEEK